MHTESCAHPPSIWVAHAMFSLNKNDTHISIPHMYIIMSNHISNANAYIFSHIKHLLPNIIHTVQQQHSIIFDRLNSYSLHVSGCSFALSHSHKGAGHKLKIIYFGLRWQRFHCTDVALCIYQGLRQINKCVWDKYRYMYFFHK